MIGLVPSRNGEPAFERLRLTLRRHQLAARVEIIDRRIARLLANRKSK